MRMLQARLFLAILLTLSFFYPQILSAYKPVKIYAYRNFRKALSEKMILIGRIQSKSKEKTTSRKNEVEGYDMRFDRLTVKLFENKGLRIGQKLFIVNKNSNHQQFKNAHIVGELEIVSIYYDKLHKSWMLKGRGIFLRIRRGFFVARGLETESLEAAYILKRQGDKYANINQNVKAITYYKKALQLDKSLPEAHAGLADVYLANHKKNAKKFDKIESIAIQAIYSYKRAWDFRKNFRYEYEKLEYFYNYINLLIKSYELHSKELSHDTNIVKDLDLSIKIANELSAIYLKQNQKTGFELASLLAQIHYYRMQYYSIQSNKFEREEYDFSQKQADYWLKKLLAMDEKTAKSLRIAILFYHHRYKQFGNVVASDKKMKSKLRLLILNKLGPYYLLYLNKKQRNINPQVKRILSDLNSARLPLQQKSTQSN